MKLIINTSVYFYIKQKVKNNTAGNEAKSTDVTDEHEEVIFEFNMIRSIVCPTCIRK